jgi:hypothetical protein
MSVHRNEVRRNSGIRTGFVVAVIFGWLAGLAVLPVAAFAEGNGVPLRIVPQGAIPAAASSVAADTIPVGATQFLWAYAQGFFAGYYRLSATCQQKTAHAYYFTEDAYLNDVSASPTDPDLVFAAGSGGLYKSVNGGLTWAIDLAGLPTVDGVYNVFDSTNNYYNRRAPVHCLFSRREFGESSNLVWAGTEFGVFYSTALGDTFRIRATGMNFDAETGADKPPVYDILGHPAETEWLWAATLDGVYMTRNANRWVTLSRGLPPGEGTIWANGPAYALAYDPAADLLFALTDKGVFYGKPRYLSSSATSDVLVSWKPLGGEVALTLDPVRPPTADSLWLSLPASTSQSLEIGAGQYITVVDTVQDVYWSALVDIGSGGLFAVLSDSGIFYYPQGTTPPDYVYNDTTLFRLDHCIAYGYAQVSGKALHLDTAAGAVTVRVGTEGNGIYQYRFTGDISSRYYSAQETISSSHAGEWVYRIAKKDDAYFIATTNGLFRADDPLGDWTRLTGCLYNNNRTDSVAVDTRTVAFGPGDLIFTGGYMGGFLRSEDGVVFTPSNLGMMHRNGTLNQINIFASQLEDATPADPEKGIYRIVQDWWGDLPGPESNLDAEGDSLITVLFLDIDDQYYLSTGDGTFINGYYDGTNEYSILYFTNSNQREMFYVDTDPQWINQGAPAACNQMFNLINWNQDFGEEVWLREGMAAFSQYVAGYPLATGVINFPLMNNLTSWGDYNRNIERMYSFLLVLYLYEQAFPDTVIDSLVIHRISEVALSPYHGVSGLGRLLYEKTVGPSSSAEDYTETFASFFRDFILAGSLDISDTTFAENGKYGFKAINCRISASSYNWYWTPTTSPPFKWQLPFWSARAVQIVDTLFFNNAHPIRSLLVNGDDRNILDFKLLFSSSGNFEPEMPQNLVTVVPIPTDNPQQKGRVDLPPELQLGNGNTPPNILRLITVCTSDSGQEISCYVLEDDTLAPPFLYLTVAQNPIDSRYLDIYTFANERIFPDGGRLYQVDDMGLTDLEGPMIRISGGASSVTGNDTTITLDQNIFYANTQNSDFVYHIAYHLDKLVFPDSLFFTGYGENAAGNEKESDARKVSVDYLLKQSGGALIDAATGAAVFVPAEALQQDALILLSVGEVPPGVPEEVVGATIASAADPDHFPVGPLVFAGSAAIDLTAPIELTIPFDRTLAGSRDVGVYRSEGGSWVYIGGAADPEAGLLRAVSAKFGKFRAFAGPPGDMQASLPHVFRLEQNFPNPFNSATRVQFELSRAQKVKLDIYNIQGARVARLVDAPLQAGRHSVSWTPRNLAGGIYFLRLESEEGTLYRKMIFLK